MTDARYRCSGFRKCKHSGCIHYDPHMEKSVDIYDMKRCASIPKRYCSVANDMVKCVKVIEKPGIFFEPATGSLFGGSRLP